MWTAAVLAVATYLLYAWVKKTLTYWKDRNVNGPTPVPFVGNFGKFLTFQESIDSLTWDIYKRYPQEKVVGFYQGYRPTLMVRDLELLKYVFIKDFSIFQDREAKYNDGDKFLDNLFSAEEETWRILRQKLTPIFTSGKLRSMIPLIQKCIDDYMSYVDKLVDGGKDYEIKTLSSQYTLEVIGTCAFGLDMGTFNDAPNPFLETGNSIFTPSKIRRILQTLQFYLPHDVLKYIFKYAIPAENPTTRRFFINLVNGIVKQREGKPKLRNDFMDLMIELKEQGIVERKDAHRTMELEMDTELLAAQSFVFFAAGFETSSSAMSFLMYELANNQQIQERLYKDITMVTERNGGKITYDSIKDMEYLDMCFDEALRKYPVVATLMRRSGEKYTFPDTKYTLEKGMMVMVSVLGIHRDPQYYKDPDVFDPERFSPENKQSIPRLAYLPFGDGPRNCIGMRFAKVQSMLGLAAFLRKFKVDRSAKTPSHIEFDPRGLSITSKEGIWLKITRR